MRMRRMARTLVVVGAAAAVLAACTSPDGDGGTADPSDEASSTADPTDAVVDHAVATFAVVDEEFRVELVTEELVAHAQQLLDGEDIAAIPLGDVVRDDPGVNSPWSWHLDPATVEFAFATTECVTACRRSSRTGQSRPISTARGRPRSSASSRCRDPAVRGCRRAVMG